MQAKVITDAGKFISNAVAAIKNSMSADGFEQQYRQYIEPNLTEVIYSKNSNRRVIGSVNDMVGIIKYLLSYNDADLIEVTALINDTPFSMLDYRSPRKAFVEMSNKYTFSLHF